MSEEEYFDAHIGVAPDQSVHVRDYSSIICSNCITAINFKITRGEFEKLKDQLHTKTTQVMSDNQKVSNEGKPMFIESLMTDEEWTRRMRAFPNTSRFRPNEVNLHKTNNFKWRLNMGKTLTSIQIGNINRNLDYLLKKAREAHG